MDVQPSDVMSVPEAAAFLRMGETHVWGLIRREGLPVIRLGRRVIVLRGQLMAWLEERMETGASR